MSRKITPARVIICPDGCGPDYLAGGEAPFPRMIGIIYQESFNF